MGNTGKNYEGACRLYGGTGGKMGRAVECRNVTKIYGWGEGKITAVDHVDLCVDEGEYVVISGASGSGKSTLLYMIGGMEEVSEGEISIFGRNMRMKDEELAAFRREHIGFIFQQFHLFPQLTVYQNVILPAMKRGNLGYEKKARELMEYLGIADKEKQYPVYLSGGQQQRVAVARALVTGAKLILADEPTGNLDSVSGENVKQLLENVRKEFGVTLIVVSHDPDYEARAGRVIRMRDGRWMR